MTIGVGVEPRFGGGGNNEGTADNADDDEGMKLAVAIRTGMGALLGRPVLELEVAETEDSVREREGGVGRKEVDPSVDCRVGGGAGD